MALLHKLVLTAGALSMIALTGCNNDNAADDRNGINNNTRDVSYVNDNDNVVNDNNRYIRDNNGRNGVDGSLRNVRNVNDNDMGLNNPLRNVGNENDRNGEEPLMNVADEAADRVADLQGVQRASVIVTERNAYVAAQLDDNAEGKLTRQMENNIANAVRKTDADIQNVYVSTNPDFIDRMDNYVNDIGEGRPVGGLFDEFTEVVRRVFPNAR
ncbi:YhcN/YlaJ family sporulation lipoprotein [Priestia abyssalis]|uniref:YhcN/YlaJ family sporulation lipoprotein n=1 Tax=Priestia abyssalis TaxID=1221450 RepID=UPI000995B396|nr:YhcN/YlaJ family sporulation lipoprotein [Priestia abyssalis]